MATIAVDNFGKVNDGVALVFSFFMKMGIQVVRGFGSIFLLQ